jgi:raffinose/stachyose/melibiose transport system permease protein
VRRRPGDPTLWFAAPALALYALVVLYPSFAGAAAAFTDWDGLGGGRSFIGLDNFRRLFEEDAARGALRNTLLLTLFVVCVQNALALALAIGLHRVAGRLRVVFLVPAVISPLVIAFVWKYLLGPADDEGINALLGLAGLGGQDWLGDPALALWSIGMTAVWQHCGLALVIYLAALQAIPRELLDAAALDGARRWRKLRHVTLPLLAPALTINLVLSTVGALKLFDQVFAITGGGPGYATETLSTLIYKQAFTFGRYGYATAIALVLTLLVAAVALAQIQVLRRQP